MYAPPGLTNTIPMREYPFTSPYPMRWAWVRPVEEVRRTPRKGKWIPEEEEYTQKLIECFNKGYLNIAQSTTLRSCLSEKLNCDPMRITKKYAGSACIGKQVFQPCKQTAENAEEIKAALADLTTAERRFLSKIEHTSRPHRYPYVVYGPEPVSLVPETVPADFMHPMHDYMHHMPYMMNPPARTFFPEHEATPDPAQYLRRYPAQPPARPTSPASTDGDKADTPKSNKSQRDIEEGGLLLDFFKSVRAKEDPEPRLASDQPEVKVVEDNDDNQTAEEEAESPTAKVESDHTHAPAAATTPSVEASKRSSEHAASSRKRSMSDPDALAARQAPVHLAAHTRPYPHVPMPFIHARAAIGPSPRMTVLPGMPTPPVPPLDFQGLPAYPFPAIRGAHQMEYEQYVPMHPMSDQIHRIPYPIMTDGAYGYKAPYPLPMAIYGEPVAAAVENPAVVHAAKKQRP